jgi:hypothetical protein
MSGRMSEIASDMRMYLARLRRWWSQDWRCALFGHATPLTSHVISGLGIWYGCARCRRAVQFLSMPS